MKDFKEYIVEQTEQDFIKKLEKKFPLNASNWEDATQEIVDMAGHLDELLDIDTLPRKRASSPSEYNKVHIERIKNNIHKLKGTEKQNFFMRWARIVN